MLESFSLARSLIVAVGSTYQMPTTQWRELYSRPTCWSYVDSGVMLAAAVVAYSLASTVKADLMKPIYIYTANPMNVSLDACDFT